MFVFHLFHFYPDFFIVCGKHRRIECCLWCRPNVTVLKCVMKNNMYYSKWLLYNFHWLELGMHEDGPIIIFIEKLRRRICYAFLSVTYASL